MAQRIFIFAILIYFVLTFAYAFTEKQIKKESQNINQPILISQPDKNNNIDPMVFIYNYFLKTEYKDVALEITAMSYLETGNWKSKFHAERNNYWSTKIRPDGKTCINGEKNCLATYNNIEHACEKMYMLLKRKKYKKDPEGFLHDVKRKKFATDPHYITKIKKCKKIIVKKLKEKNI